MTLKISQEERDERIRTTNFARGNVQLEGFKLDAEMERIIEQYVNGEITADEQMRFVFSTIR